MDWPEDLLEIFDDPLFADVRLKPQALTPDDRMAQKLLKVNNWFEANGHEPMATGSSTQEKLLARSLKALRKQTNDSLRQYDVYHLLG